MNLTIKRLLASLMVKEAKTLNYKNLDKIVFVDKDLELFEAIKYSVDKKGFVCPDTIIAKLPHLEDYLQDIASQFMSGNSVEEFIETIYNQQLKFRLKNALNFDTNKENIEMEIISKIKKLEDLIKETGITENYSKTGNDLYIELLEEIDSPIDESSFLETGYGGIDEMVNLSQGDLWVVAGRPSMGKTTFVCEIARSMAKKGKKVKILSLEMSSLALQKRIISSVSGVPLIKLINKRMMSMLTEKEKDQLAGINTHADYINSNISYYDETSATIDSVETQIKIAAENGNDVVMIDYAQFITNKETFATENLRIANIVKRLKKVGRDNEVLVLLLAQVNRSCEARADRRPIMSDLDGSSELEKTADIISFLYRDEYYNDESEFKGLMEVITRKQRQGATGTVQLKFLGEIQRITDYTTRVF